MTPLRHSASPAVSGIAGAGSLPGVQAAVAGSSPAKFRPSDFALGGVDSVCPTRASSPRATEAKGTTEVMRATARVSATSRCNSGPSAPFNDCGGVDSDTPIASTGLRLAMQHPVTPGRVDRVSANEISGSRCNSGPQSPICPELTAYITTLLAVVGAIAWAHVFSMDLKLANQLINFHPKEVICDGLGNKPEFLCAVSHKEGE